MNVNGERSEMKWMEIEERHARHARMTYLCNVPSFSSISLLVGTSMYVASKQRRAAPFSTPATRRDDDRDDASMTSTQNLALSKMYLLYFVIFLYN